jgi:hypothetical protein
MNDLKFALRQLLKNPGFTAVAVLTIALCIGANTAIFSVVNAVLLEPFPYPDSERLVYVNNSYPGNDLLKAGVSIPDYLDRVEQAPSIEAAMLYTFESFNLSGEDRPARVMGLRVTPSMFETLGVSPRLGRPFDSSESQPGSERVVLLSHSLWIERFGGRESVVGETLRLHGVSYSVVGVMPESFEFPQPNVQLWVPYAFTAQQRSDAERGTEYSSMLARLKPGATSAQLERECDTIIDRNLERLPEDISLKFEEVAQQLQADLKRLSSNSTLKQSREGGHYLHAEDPDLAIQGIRQALAAIKQQNHEAIRPMNDLKYALRQLAKNPGFTAVAVLTLALGIEANTDNSKGVTKP